MTMRLYADRKEWELPPFTIEVAHEIVPGKPDGTPPRDRFNRHIAFEGALADDRRDKLLEIADKCPVHRTLMRGFEAKTDTGPASEIGRAHVRTPVTHAPLVSILPLAKTKQIYT